MRLIDGPELNTYMKTLMSRYCVIYCACFFSMCMLFRYSGSIGKVPEQIYNFIHYGKLWLSPFTYHITNLEAILKLHELTTS